MRPRIYLVYLRKAAWRGILVLRKRPDILHVQRLICVLWCMLAVNKRQYFSILLVFALKSV